MSDANDPHQPAESRSLVSQFADWIQTGIKVLFALACLGIGLFGGLFSITFLAGDVPGWAIAVGLFSVACLALGGKMIWGLWKDKSEPKGEKTQAQPGARDESSEKREAADHADDKKGVLSAITNILSAVRTATSLLFFVLASAFLSVGVYLGYRALRAYREAGFETETATFAGFALLIFTVLSVFALRGWRQWKESRHTYEKPPGAYRRAWRTRRIQATGFRSHIELLGGLISSRAKTESWYKTIIGSLITWAAVGLIAYFFIWPFLQEGPIVPALVLSGVFLGLPGSTALYSTYLLYKAARHRMRYDPAVFVMDSMPAVLGGTLRGTVETGLSLEDRPPDGFHIVLTCYKRRARRGDKKTSYHTLWYAEAQTEGQHGPDGTVHVPVTFDLPEDQPPVTLERLRTRTIWRLEITADETDPPYDQYIDLPVFPADAAARPEAATSPALEATRHG